MRIKYVNQPKARADGKPPKFANIVMETGEKFWVNVGLLNLYQPGMEINPPFEVQKWGDLTAHVIPAHWSPTMNGGAQAPTQAPPPPPTHAPVYAPPNSNLAQAGTNHPPAMDKEMGMFVMGVTGRAMQSGKYEINDIKMIALAAAEAWRELQAKL